MSPSSATVLAAALGNFSNPNPLHLIEANIIPAPVIEASGA
jgi:hypothetical protein